MPDFKFVPIVTWPRTPTRDRRRSPFSAGQKRTLEDLRRELDHLGAYSVVIQTYHRESDIRLDGMPKASAPAPSNPSVILSFTTRQGSYSYPCDTYSVWTANLRAVVLTLERLRAIDRYGVTKHGEQYTGWKALPPASPVSSNGMTREVAAAFLAGHGPMENGRPLYDAAALLRSPSLVDLVYHSAARKLHPDRGGDHDAFVELQRAVELLRAR
jgi:hypothetical protein